MANDKSWQRRTDDWVAAQHRSNKRKAEADRRDKHGEERRDFMARQTPGRGTGAGGEIPIPDAK